MAKRVMAVFGDDFFPKLGYGNPSEKRNMAFNNVHTFFRVFSPSLVYVIPTKGTSTYVTMLCHLMKIPYVLISPYPGFFDSLTATDKSILERSLQFAKTSIIMNEDKQEDHDKAWRESVRFLVNSCNQIVLIHSVNTSEEYGELVNYIVDNCKKGKEIIDLSYDGGEDFFN